MAYYNLPIASPQPDGDAQPGVHYIDLHFRGGNGLRHQSVQMGDRSPLDYPIGQLSLYVLERADEQANDRWSQPTTFSRLVGMTVYQTASHEIESPQGNVDHRLVAEKLVSFAFVKKTGIYVPARYYADVQPSIFGVARMRVGDKPYYVQHLGEIPEEATDYPIRFATPSISARGKDHDTWVGLRPKTSSVTKQRNSFRERIVDNEELNDTRK